jgi:hypothetical protein
LDLPHNFDDLTSFFLECPQVIACRSLWRVVP